MDKYYIINQLFPQKSWDFYTIRSIGMGIITTYWVLCSRLTYFWRNMNISSILYISKSTSINTQYSSLWDTLTMMLFTKYLIKWKCIGRISGKFQYWNNFRSSIRIRCKKIDVMLVHCSFSVMTHFFFISSSSQYKKSDKRLLFLVLFWRGTFTTFCPCNQYVFNNWMDVNPWSRDIAIMAFWD